MGHQASRPIVASVTDTGVVYVPIARDREYITINAAAGGLTGVAVDWTNDNIQGTNPGGSYDNHRDPSYVAPANAVWEVLQANAITTAVVGVPLQALALRLTGTGTGTARVVITQSS
jgi:hypothetical protein